MRQCKKCNLEILDETSICPLCRNVLEETDEKGGDRSGYPDVTESVRKFDFVVRLYSFLAIIMETVFVIINYMTYRGQYWSIITGIGILYFYITLKYSVQKNMDHRSIIWIQIIGAALLIIVVDNIRGYQGWSVNYIMPGAILLLDITIMILMIVNRVNYQDYLLMQIFTVLASVTGLFLWYFQIITRPLPTVAAVSLSLYLFLATVILGDRKAKAELKRRFHV